MGQCLVSNSSLRLLDSVGKIQSCSRAEKEGRFLGKEVSLWSCHITAGERIWDRLLVLGEMLGRSGVDVVRVGVSEVCLC